ncbi:response regulator transcription factor [Kitasatospora sp. NBC_00315]|uniref:response regulator transcription factor n=1 Tax=Kitasatospora sp. NBC_00315 TaxID=2975963 RepID=UPI0032472EE2
MSTQAIDGNRPSGDITQYFRSVLVADHDPIARHFLVGVLGQDSRLSIVGGVDSHRPPSEWPLSGVGVVILSTSFQQDPGRTVREVVARGVQVLLIAVGWTAERLDAAFAAGAGGCLVKNLDTRDLSAAVHGVGAGYRVLSPELAALSLTRTSRQPGAASAATIDELSPDEVLSRITDREREVLTALAHGLSTAETAELLHVSPATVKSHVSHVLTKLGVRNRLEAVLAVQRALGASPPQSQRDCPG